MLDLVGMCSRSITDMLGCDGALKERGTMKIKAAVLNKTGAELPYAKSKPRVTAIPTFQRLKATVRARPPWCSATRAPASRRSLGLTSTTSRSAIMW